MRFPLVEVQSGTWVAFTDRAYKILHRHMLASHPACDLTGVFDMTNKPVVHKDTKKQAGISHPGMMGDGTEEQNLGERGNPAGRIKKDEVEAAFGKQNPKK
jgi:hypothetical protein